MEDEQVIEITGEQLIQLLQLVDRVAALETEVKALKQRTEAVDRQANERLVKIGQGIDELKRIFQPPSGSPRLN